MTEIQNTTTASNTPSITVYWLNESRADRILLLLEELELPYVIEKFDRGSDKLAPDELKKIHPLGKSPVIKDGDKVVAESGFIIDYIIDKYGKDKNLKPTNSEDLFQYNYVCYLYLIISIFIKILFLVFTLY
jgi:glutathione S-transferase